jgi:squalene-associated FAD-dependent desaturase
LGYLTLRERLSLARALWRLARTPTAGLAAGATIGSWLVDQKQSAVAIDRFWAPVLVSALGESLDRASLAYARKVFVDGFMMSRRGYQIDVPRVPLGELYGERLSAWLAAHGVTLRLGTPIREVCGSAGRVTHVMLEDGAREPFDAVVLAVPWRRVSQLIAADSLREALPFLETLERIEAAPITGVHLWFDQEITSLPHAVLLGMTSQWLFNHGASAGANSAGSPRHYYQVVISASRNLAGQDREHVIREIVRELGQIWPAAHKAQLLHSRLVTEQAAVFSVTPQIDSLRPAQRTAIANLAMAGDWTATGWPATMEGAVRSGYLAAEALLAQFGRPERLVVPDLTPSFLARILFSN